jgi:PIN domain nuclease of toxin-antitoxin system
MKNILFLLLGIVLFASCGLLKNTARSRQVVSINSTQTKAVIDSSKTITTSTIDTTIMVYDTCAMEVNTILPDADTSDVNIDSIYSAVTENEFYKVQVQYLPNLKKLKTIVQPKPKKISVQASTRSETQNHISATQDTQTQTKTSTKEVVKTAAVNWTIIILTITVLLIGITTIFIYLKTK